MLDFLDTKNIVALAVEQGLNKIRCSLTGAVIAHFEEEYLIRSIRFEQYGNTLASDDMILDSIQTKWIIASSRPSPHLVGHTTKDGFKWLRNNYPSDLFAILASRMIFERADVQRRLNQKMLLLTKMQWLIDWQDYVAANGFTDSQRQALECMIRIDAIHNVRHAFFDPNVRKWADRIIEDEFDADSFLLFVQEVEARGMIQLTRQSKPSERANSMSLSAALDQHGMIPENLIAKEEEEQKKAENQRRAINSMNSRNAGKSGTIKVNHGKKVTNEIVNLHEIRGTMTPELEARYAAVIADRRAKNIKPTDPDAVKTPKATKTAHKMEKALARFGNLGDLDF